MAGILSNAMMRLPGYQQGGPVIHEYSNYGTPPLGVSPVQYGSYSPMPTQPSYSLGWDYSSGVPQLRPGLSTPPSYGRQASPGFTNEGRYTPVQIGATPTGIDYSARYRDRLAQDSGSDNGSPLAGGPQYDSAAQAGAWISNAARAGYYGTIDDAAAQAREGNQKAINALQGFVGSGEAGTTLSGGKGLLGNTLTNQINNITGGLGDSSIPQNLTTAVQALDDAGALHSDDSSSGYVGEDLQQQQNISDAAATSTYGDWSSWSDDSSSSDDGWSDSDSDTGGWDDSFSSDFDDAW